MGEPVPCMLIVISRSRLGSGFESHGSWINTPEEHAVPVSPNGAQWTRCGDVRVHEKRMGAEGSRGSPAAGWRTERRSTAWTTASATQERAEGGVDGRHGSAMTSARHVGRFGCDTLTCRRSGRDKSDLAVQGHRPALSNCHDARCVSGHELHRDSLSRCTSAGHRRRDRRLAGPTKPSMLRCTEPKTSAVRTRRQRHKSAHGSTHGQGQGWSGETSTPS